jgi:hypothetical protein
MLVQDCPAQAKNQEWKMNRYLFLGTTEVDSKWLEIRPDGGHVTYNQIVPVRIYKPMPFGYTSPPNKKFTINVQFAPASLEVEPSTWLSIVPESKVPVSTICIPLDY